MAKEIEEFVPTNQKGNRGYYSYSYFPGVVHSGTLLLWEGDFEGATYCVNSAAPGNQVGDAFGYSNGFETQWLQHANWGYLDMESMLVFDPPVGNELSDEELWMLGDGSPIYQHMADRDSTGFGMVVGSLHGPGIGELFALMPENSPRHRSLRLGSLRCGIVRVTMTLFVPPA